MRFDEYMRGNLQQFPQEEARKLSYAFLWANRALDTIKESLWVEHALPNTSEFIHNIAHVNLERLDQFADTLHENHILQVYPGTPELEEPIADVDTAFEIAVDTIDEVDMALNNVIKACEGGTYNAVSLAAENLQQANSADRTKVLQAWQMWDTSVSKTSFDNWVLHLNGGACNV